MWYDLLAAADHLELATAEFWALSDVHNASGGIRKTGSRFFTTNSRDVAERFQQRMAWGERWQADESTPRGIAAVIERLHTDEHLNDPAGRSAAVRSIRHGETPGMTRNDLERRIGAVLVERGWRIDLTSPDLEVFAWIQDDDTLSVGELLGARADDGAQARRMDERDHFAPIGLHPRRAAGLVNLARVAPGGRILDPFCGTGGIVMEAARLGYDAWGSDLDPWMVQGTHSTLADAADEPLPATVFHADIGDVPDLVDGVQGIVTDMPYGGASSTHDEPLRELYERALDAFARILPEGGYAVIGHKDRSLLDGAVEHGFDPAYHWNRAGTVPSKLTNPANPEPVVYSEYVHGSMTRHYAVLRRV